MCQLNVSKTFDIVRNDTPYANNNNDMDSVGAQSQQSNYAVWLHIPCMLPCIENESQRMENVEICVRLKVIRCDDTSEHTRKRPTQKSLGISKKCFVRLK